MNDAINNPEHVDKLACLELPVARTTPTCRYISIVLLMAPWLQVWQGLDSFCQSFLSFFMLPISIR